MTSKEVKRPLNGTLAVSLGLVRSITLYRKLKMPQGSRKNSHNRRGRKPTLPPKSDILSGKPLKKDSLFIRTLNATSPVRNPQYGEPPSRKPDGPHQELAYKKKKDELEAERRRKK